MINFLFLAPRKCVSLLVCEYMRGYAKKKKKSSHSGFVEITYVELVSF